MDPYQALLDISRLLLLQDGPEPAARTLLLCLLEAAGAERGFVVVREGQSFEQKFDVRYDRDRCSEAERSFSRSLVRHVLETRQIVDSPSVVTDPRFSGQESVQSLGEIAVLVVPLSHGEEVWGVLYLQRQGASFPDGARRLVGDLAGLAGLFLKRASEREALEERNRSLERDLYAKHSFPGILTTHPRMLELLRVVAQVADSDAGVLLLGESGTGKELLATALHVNSSRRARPFVTLHCAALPASVLESELFGHKKGAFTGADRDRPGRLAAADGGTLLLDEVAEIPAEVQAKLLRFLQFGEIQAVGSDRTERLDVRVLAATHRDLGSLVKEGRFRQDLYFRIKVLELRIPPLRERRSDVPLLVQSFTRKHWRRRTEEPRWSTRAESALSAYEWPGNVRELEHVVQRACLLATGPELDLSLLPEELLPTVPLPEPPVPELTNDGLSAARERAVEEVERAFLDELMRRHDGNITQAARAAGMYRSYLHKLLARYRPAAPL